jgi:hypothetical protein
MPPTRLRSQFQPGTWALFGILRDNDQHQAIFRNTGLWAALSGSVKLRNDAAPFQGNAPTCFLELVTAALADFRTEQAKGLPPSHLGAKYVSDYDVHAFQAAASALAEICWPERAGDNFSGPPLRDCLQRLRATDEGDIGWLVVEQYVGTLLQRCFNDAGIRRQVRGLAPETESELRTVEAKRFVTLARVTPEKAGASDPAEQVWAAAGDFWNQLALS